MQQPTKEIAREIVQGLKNELSRRKLLELGNIRSVFVTGSYVRGDWLDCCSDLDINILFLPNFKGPIEKDVGYRVIRSTANKILRGRPFPSQCPSGIDWSIHPGVPTREKDVRNVSGYLLFNIFLFDFLEHSEILWGEDFRPLMPAPPDPVSLAPLWFERVLNKIGQLGDSEADCWTAAKWAYNSIVIAQMAFGERTLDKTRMLSLYMRNIPAFPMKVAGERVIREYIGSIYPDRRPRFEKVEYYRQLIQGLWEMIIRRGNPRAARDFT
jgi:hypothetical protein